VVFLLRLLLVMLAVPLIVIADWAVYHYAGTVAGNVAVVISIPVIVYALWRLGRWDDDEFDPLSADRRRR
jgi:hypothetical protein